ncbi:TPA: group II intron reverse transcriptase/maturase, partial [Streptococcus equi subsp. zooepidemicus]|nr:group II intron reverse transcriptase/maturase [Streptococcus equi subsp. zooepidemicus]
VMKYLMENAHLYPTLEMADNALSRYIAQKGKCAVTHNALTVADMMCEHIKPCKGKRNDTYRNLIILSKEVSDLVGTLNSDKISKILKNLPLTKEMQDKINKLREYRELEMIQFEDYIGTKK